MQDLRVRTREFALRVIRLYRALPKGLDAQVVGKQILRCGTSVGAQYREACRAKSNADFVNKLEGALQELDETSYWLELLGASGIIKETRLRALENECNELTAMFVSMTKSTKRKAVRS